MKRKSLSKYLFITLFVALTMGCITACRESDTPKGLSAPAYAKADFWNVTWVDVENANGYTVRLPDVSVEVKTKETSLSLFEYFKPNTKYSIEIKANGDGVTYLDSEWKTITYHTEAVTKGLVYTPCNDGTYEVMCKADKVPENGEIVYPDTYNGKAVTGISAEQKNLYTYFPYPTLYRVRLPASLTDLGSHAFNNSRIKEIYLPEGLERLWSWAFVDCKYLTTVSTPKTLQRIDCNTFEGCTSLQTVEFPDSLIRIDDFAFYNSGLTSITLPNSLEYLGIQVFDNTAWYNAQADGVLYIDDALYGYKGEIPEGTVLNNLAPIRKVVDNAFKKYDKDLGKYIGYSGIKEIIIPEGCTTIGSNAFFHCEDLQKVVLPESLTTIKDNAFMSCENLTDINLPENLISIGKGAFFSCGMETIKIPKNVTYLKSLTFVGCDNLKTVILPSTMKILDISIFSNCPNLDLIIPDTIQEVVVNGVLFITDFNYNIFFQGNEDLWDSITSENGVTSVEKLTYLNIYFYSEEQPDEEGKFWHYDTDGNPVVWA